MFFTSDKKSHRCTICFSQGPDFKCDTKPLARPFKVHSARLLCPHAVGLQCCNVSSRIWIGFGRYFIARLFNHWSRRLFRLCPLSFWDEESFRGDQKKEEKKKKTVHHNVAPCITKATWKMTAHTERKITDCRGEEAAWWVRGCVWCVSGMGGGGAGVSRLWGRIGPSVPMHPACPTRTLGAWSGVFGACYLLLVDGWQGHCTHTHTHKLITEA